jgi:hypothetical protein
MHEELDKQKEVLKSNIVDLTFEICGFDQLIMTKDAQIATLMHPAPLHASPQAPQVIKV